MILPSVRHALPCCLTLGVVALNGSASADSTRAPQALPITTAAGTELRLSEQPALVFTPHAVIYENEPSVVVVPGIEFQEILGIGGAITDSSAETLAKLPAAKQKELLDAYYDPVKGIGYSLIRTNIASCDFSSGSYAYVKEGDAELKSFSVAHDEKYRIPMIQRALAAAGGKATVFASPWSPPGWMKDTGQVLQGGKLKPEFRDAWARHFVEFIHAYEARGIPIWGVTVQNEPMAKQKWESCIFSAEEERDFIRDHLGPTLAKAGLGDRKIVAWDHNRDLIFQRASILLADPKAAAYIWGLGYHWYETWTGGGMQFQNLIRTKEAFPKINLLFTEGCAESFDATRYAEWVLGERYGYSMIHDFNAGAVGWTDWNVLLDEKGGPNHVGNFCFAPVHADTRTGELIYTNSYHYLGHFSKFVRPGARRIAVSTTREPLLSTGFRNPDGSLVVVVMNQTEKPLPYQLWLGGQAAATTALPRSITTFIIR